MAELDRKRLVGRALWGVNLLTFFGLCAWIAWDGQFSEAASMLPAKLGRRLDEVVTLGWPVSQHTARLLGLALAGVLALGSTIGIFASLFLGSRAHRRVRSWLAFTVLVSAWLALAVSWRELAWQSQTVRLKWNLTGFEAVADTLRTDWPAADGERMGVGPFMAYPHGNPSMLMLLTTPDVAQTSALFAAIEALASWRTAVSISEQRIGRLDGVASSWIHARIIPRWAHDEIRA